MSDKPGLDAHRGRGLDRRADPCQDTGAKAEGLFGAFCDRGQARSPFDVDDLCTLVGEHGQRVLPWLPESIGVRENLAHVFAAWFRGNPAMPDGSTCCALFREKQVNTIAASELIVSAAAGRTWR